MTSNASVTAHVGRVCPQRGTAGTAATEPREAFGVRRIPALLLRAVRNSHIAPEYGALQTLRALVCHFREDFRQKNWRQKMGRVSLVSTKSWIVILN